MLHTVLYYSWKLFTLLILYLNFELPMYLIHCAAMQLEVACTHRVHITICLEKKWTQYLVSARGNIGLSRNWLIHGFGLAVINLQSWAAKLYPDRLVHFSVLPLVPRHEVMLFPRCDDRSLLKFKPCTRTLSMGSWRSMVWTLKRKCQSTIAAATTSNRGSNSIWNSLREENFTVLASIGGLFFTIFFLRIAGQI